MNRRKILVLSIGFTLILITCIIVVIFLIHDIKTEAFDPLDKKLIAPVYVFFVFQEFPLMLYAACTRGHRAPLPAPSSLEGG